MGVGVGTGSAEGISGSTVGAAALGLLGLTDTSVPLRLVDTITMTARITATTRISPKIICHLVLLAARS